VKVGDDAPRSWWSVRRIELAILAAAMVAATAFVYRFNTLGGTLGGFDNDHFAHLLRSEMLLRGEQPLRDFADAELRGAWPALSYAVPAWAQQLGGRTLLSEAYLTVGALALACALVCVLALDLSKRYSVALLAAAVAIAAAPRLYNYPKVVMLAVGAAAIHAAVQRPSFTRLAFAAAATAAATLFRHDYGVYVAVGAIAGLVARDAGAWSAAARRVGAYAALTTALLLPSAVWVQRYEGLPTYLVSGLASSWDEISRTEPQLPLLGSETLADGDRLVALTYYAFWMVVVIAVAVGSWRMRRDAHGLPHGSRATGMALLAMTIVVNVVFLRTNLVQRFGDAIVPVVLLACWSVGAAAQASAGVWRAAGMLVPTGLLLFMLGTVYAFRDMGRDFHTSGLSVSWERTRDRFASIRQELAGLPPAKWAERDVDGPLRVSRYVAECTSPDDYLFVAGYAPEIAVLARRRFAAGLGTVSLSFYTSERDQQRALARLAHQSVPVALADASGFDEFRTDYPLLAQYLASRYREAGRIPANDDRAFLVFVDHGRQSSGRDAHYGLPCFR
jgi:hypothetical protein